MFGHLHQTVAVEGFSGPFDLLLRLIERRELDVLAISLAEVTEQYLDHLSALRLRDPEHLTAFLVVAAKLLFIKSSLLLPSRARPKDQDDPTPDDPTDLAERLLVYRRFREAAADLGVRHDVGIRSYPHPPIPYQPAERERAEPLDPRLLRAALVQAQDRAHPSEPAVVEANPRLSVAEALTLVQISLDRLAPIVFSELVHAEPSRQRIVAIFLAVLELVRRGHASVTQDDHFAEIRLTRPA